MAVSRLLFCAASLAVLDLKMFANASTNTLTFENKELEGCLASLNTARGAAGLEALEKGDDLLNSLEYGQGLGKAICEFVEGSDSTNTNKNGTFGVLKLASKDDNPDCNAAVQSWQSGFSLFEQTPPETTKVGDYVKDPKALSFLTLYNPKANKGLCKVITCTPQEEVNAKSGLVCVTSPNFLDGTTLYTDDQWQKIAKVFSSSASSTVPSLFAVAAVLAAASLL